MRSGIIKTIHELMRKDKSIYFLTGDLGFNVLEEIQGEFPKRVLNMGVAEQNMMSVAAGLALSGKKVYVYSIIPFATMRCYEQIRNDVCYNKADVTILGVGSGLSYGILSSTHFALEDIAIIRALPNITVFSPADEIEAVLGVKELYKQKGPAYIRIGKKEEPKIYDKPYDLKIGKGNLLLEGSDITIFATGTIMSEVLKAAELLRGKKIKTSVVNIHTIKPLDKNLIVQESRFKKHVFVIEEHGKIGGLGSAILEAISEEEEDFPKTTLIGTDDHFIKDIGSQDYLRSVTGLSSTKIVDKITKALKLI